LLAITPRLNNPVVNVLLFYILNKTV